MSTISVPLAPELEKFITAQVKSGHAASKADVVRRALVSMRENAAVQAVLSAQREPTVRGDLRKLMKELS